ncbi:heavy metal sensor histidine kinase [Pantoea sp. MBD-2R]|uniref:heavy metal sensor histidine kinase n=1 Tax=Pantoea sp. MBD-2R TaxID=3141540 RepID=UPI003182D17B
MLRISLTLRLTIVFIVLVTLACTGITFTLYRALENELIWRDEQTLINRGAQLRQLLLDGAEPASLPLYFNRMVDTHQDILVIHPARGKDVAINHTGITLPPVATLPVEQAATARALYRSRVNNGDEITILGLQGSFDGLPVTIVVARINSERARVLASYRQKSFFVSLAAVLLSAILSPLLIRRSLRAIKMLSEITATTKADQLNQPVPVGTLPAELLPLGNAMNVMRHRLAEDFARLNQFADDLAHELRTPVNILLGQNQVALIQKRTPEHYQQLIEGNIEELENLSRLTDNILFLSRADHHNITLQKAHWPLHDMLENIIDFMDSLAEEHTVSLNLDASGWVFADKILFQRAVINLLTNAIRHAPMQSQITLRARSDHTAAEVQVSNQGLPLTETEKLFRRFWRGDNSRHTPGSGLGLSLVSAIAKLHDGRCWYQHCRGENIFGISFTNHIDK